MFVRSSVCPCARSSVRPSVHPFVRSSIRPFLRSSVRSFVNSSVRSFVRSFICPFVRSPVVWSSVLFVHSFVCSFIRPLSVLKFLDFRMAVWIWQMEPQCEIPFKGIKLERLSRKIVYSGHLENSISTISLLSHTTSAADLKFFNLVGK